MLVEFRLDGAGVREVLRGEGVRQMVDDVAERVAAAVRADLPEPATVEVRGYTTDRGAATVAVLHRQAMLWQARDGLLTRAASQAGAEVRMWQR
jgi:hypothetical protein